ncbi:MAG: AAA family ATPase [Gammaproteobacteria bacterium]|nr:AAA family ATPase [Gammaproteobacteria bacterium]NIV74560.1 AAA family ATPase [Gammaproteobacteria bacterium]
MTHAEALFLVTGLLYLERRVTYRRLSKEFGLDEDLIAHVRHELTVGQRLAVDEDDAVLVWARDETPDTTRAHPTPQAPGAEADPPAGSPEGRADAAGFEAERRQLTVMFCDLVGSTALSTRLDPEDLREVITAFHDQCRAAIHRFGGFIARYMGDGVLVYFGYPQASERDAERAVRAGLDVVAAMPALNADSGARHGVELAVRVGIATGPVVVGDIVGEGAAEEAAVLGETPNLAARLQGVAQPNQVVVAGLTQRLVAQRFELAEAGRHTLKGIDEPVQAWRVIGERALAASPGGTPLIGRQAELELLTRAWEMSKDRHGQVVLIQGDAGIGKSRLVEALRERAARERYTWVAIRCSPYHVNSTLYPVIEHLKRVLEWQAEDGVGERLAQLERALAAQSLPLAEAVPLLAELLSLPLPEARYPPLAMSPTQKREATLDAVVGWLLDESERQPVLQVWEDLHWADPTTLELFGLYLEQSPTAAMLNVATYRPEFVSPWPMRSHMIPITLNRLERAEVEALIAAQVHGKALPEEVVVHIVERADGVPLYAEELTHAILESGCLDESADCYVLNRAFDELVIPATLQDSLMARLDRAPNAREVAQLGSVIGREFAYEILHLLSRLDETVLQNGLTHLVDNELLYQRGRPPRARYIFKHALIQDAAYQSLLKRTRQQHHRRLAALLEHTFPETARAHPELVAHHYTEADDAEQAVTWWRRAGERAREQSANLEAIAHLTNGLAALERLPDETARARKELELRIQLGNAYLAAKGHGAPEMEAAFQRALELCEQLGDAPELLSTLVGLWRFHVVSRSLAQAAELAGQLQRLAEQSEELAAAVMADYTVGFTALSRGDPGTGLSRFEQLVERYAPLQQRDDAAVYRAAQDPAVAAHMYGALAARVLGFPVRAREAMRAGVTLAEEIDDAFTLSFARCFAAIVMELDADTAGSREMAERASALAGDKGFRAWIAYGRISSSWIAFTQAPSDEALETLEANVSELIRIRFLALLPYFMTLLARAQHRSGRIDRALHTLDEAQAASEERDERWFDAEIHRLRGHVLLDGQGSPGEAPAACFEQAIGIARRQKAKGLELRAATSLARLWRASGETERAAALLSPLYEGFTEGFETPDLVEAHRLLATLGAHARTG